MCTMWQRPEKEKPFWAYTARVPVDRVGGCKVRALFEGMPGGGENTTSGATVEEVD